MFASNTIASFFNFPRSLEEFFSLYDLFLNNFPSQYHGLISLALVIILIYSIFKVVKKNFLFIILIVIILPQSIPILQKIWESVLQIIQFLVRR